MAEQNFRVKNGLIVGTGLTVTSEGAISGNAFESYQLDSILADGTENTFVPTFNYDRVTITNPFRLMISINGVLQSSFINNADYVYQSSFLASRTGFTIDTDNNIKFSSSVALNSDVVVRVLPGSDTTRIKYYPFTPSEILLGY